MRLLISALMRIYPARFRARFGAELRHDIDTDYQAARARGPWAACAFALATAADLIQSGIAERCRPSLRGPYDRERDMRWRLNEWVRDIRHAGRALKRTSGFTLVAAGTLGLAIGCNAGMFGVIDNVLLKPLPYENLDRLVVITASAPGTDLPGEVGVSSEFYLTYKEGSKLVEDIAFSNSYTGTMRTQDRVERIRMSSPTTSALATLGAKPILGRLPTVEDQDNVSVISHALWQQWFGGDPAVIGRAYDISGKSRTVIGVMGPEFMFPRDGVLVWSPVVVKPEEVRPGRFQSPLIARMKPGVTTEQLADELTALARGMPERWDPLESTCRHASLSIL